MKFHDTLNEKLWEGLTLKKEVKNKLNEIAEAFKAYLDINEDAIQDIRITGSSASYNYTKYSDIDLHLIIDYDKVHEDCPLVEGYLWSYKSAFNRDHDITIYGIQVEVYAENSEQAAISNGVYSLIEDRWLKEPKKIEPTTNDADVQAKYREIKEACDIVDDSEVADELLTKIYTMRKAGLEEVGEFSTENLAFKELRNAGCIEKLKQIKKQNIDKQLSLESFNIKCNGKGYKKMNETSIEPIYQKLLDFPAAEEELREAVKARKYEPGEAHIGDTIIDSDRVISLFIDTLTLEEYKKFSWDKAEDILFDKLHELEAEAGFKPEVNEDIATLEKKMAKTESYSIVNFKRLLNEVLQ